MLKPGTRATTREANALSAGDLQGTGRLVELRVREGSVVKQGELIGRLDASDVAAARAASR